MPIGRMAGNKKACSKLLEKFSSKFNCINLATLLFFVYLLYTLFQSRRFYGKTPFFSKISHEAFCLRHFQLIVYIYIRCQDLSCIMCMLL